MRYPLQYDASGKLSSILDDQIFRERQRLCAVDYPTSSGYSLLIKSR